MSDTTARTIESRKARWDRFLQMDGRQSFMHLISWTEGALERPWPTPSNRQARIDWALWSFERRQEAVAWLEDDTIPFLEPYTGTEIFAAALGCTVAYPEDNMPFARPMIDGAAEVSRVKVPELSSSSLALLFDIADELRRRAGPDALMRLIDVQSPMDIAALVWDKNTFYTALLETPEAVKDLAGRVKELLTAFLDRWFERYGTDFLAHYPQYYMRRGLTLSEDEVGSVSPRMFDTLFLPELADLSRRYGGLGMHCCANARHQWEGFKRIPGLRLLNLVQPMAVCTEALGYFSSFCAQMHSGQQEWDLALGPGQFPPDAHVVLTSTVDTREEALRRAEAFHRYFGRPDV